LKEREKTTGGKGKEGLYDGCGNRKGGARKFNFPLYLGTILIHNWFISINQPLEQVGS